MDLLRRAVRQEAVAVAGYQDPPQDRAGGDERIVKVIGRLRQLRRERLVPLAACCPCSGGRRRRTGGQAASGTFAIILGLAMLVVGSGCAGKKAQNEVTQINQWLLQRGTADIPF